jgi:hypothetical protein
MCANACPCSKPMTRTAKVCEVNHDVGIMVVKVTAVGKGFVVVPDEDSSVYNVSDALTVRANEYGTWDIA